MGKRPVPKAQKRWVDYRMDIATRNRDPSVVDPKRLRFSLELLSQGAEVWNSYRASHPKFKPYLKYVYLGDQLDTPELDAINLSGGELDGLDMTGQAAEAADFSRATLKRASFVEANINNANFEDASLEGANLSQAYVNFGNFNNAKMEHANLDEIDLPCGTIQGANLRYASFSHARAMELHAQGADLSYACIMYSNFNHGEFINTNLTYAMLINTNFSYATFEGTRVYGSAAWNLNLEGANQNRLIVSDEREPTIWVDDLEVAQFIHLLLDHRKLRKAINAVTERGVLLLGRFGSGGHEMLETIGTRLRTLGYLPIIFDFERPEGRNYTETVKTLAGLSRFVIVDLSGPSVPQELYATVPHLKVPFVPIIQKPRQTHSMITDILEYPWVIKPIFEFEDMRQLMTAFDTAIVEPAERQCKERMA